MPGAKCSYLVLSLVNCLLISSSAQSQTCYYPGNFENPKNCGKYNKIVKQAIGQCKKADNGIAKINKKILRLERRIERMLERNQLRTVQLTAKGLTFIAKLLVGPCVIEIDLDGDGILDELADIGEDQFEEWVAESLGIPMPADCVDELIARRKAKRVAYTLANMWLVYEYKKDRIEERIEDLEKSKGKKKDEKVCKCETIPALIDEEYALQCP